MEEQVNTSRSELWSLSFRDLFYKYVRFLPSFYYQQPLLFSLLYVLRYSTPIYQVGGTLLIKSEQQGRA
jgi:hypothetical protein